MVIFILKIFKKAQKIGTLQTQVEGLDYDETFAPVARLEAIHILLAFATSKGFRLHQMDVKSAFLNGYIEEGVYVRQPQALRIPSIHIIFSSYPKSCMVLSKPLELGMIDLRPFCLRIILRWVR